jgi:ABC-type polysaccharide/polyol phosphate transport system ATPase subunit
MYRVVIKTPGLFISWYNKAIENYELFYMPETILEIKNLTKDYGGEKGIFDISLSVGAGQIVGLLGPNGSGKTTTIDIILDVLKRDSGALLFKGLISSLIYLAASYFFFIYNYKVVLRKGLIARITAESL